MGGLVGIDTPPGLELGHAKCRAAAAATATDGARGASGARDKERATDRQRGERRSTTTTTNIRGSADASDTGVDNTENSSSNLHAYHSRQDARGQPPGGLRMGRDATTRGNITSAIKPERTGGAGRWTIWSASRRIGDVT